MIATQLKTTAGAPINLLNQRHLLPMTALTAILRGIGRVHGNESPTSILSFVGETRRELRPCHIHDALGQTVIVHHPVNRQVLDSDNLKSVDNSPAMLVGKVASAVGDTLVNTGHDLAAFAPLDGAFGFFGKLALGADQGLFLSAKELGRGNGLTGAQGGEVRQSHIDTDRIVQRRQCGNLNLTGKGGVPLSSGGPPDTNSLGNSIQGAVENDTNYPDFGQMKSVALQLATAGGLGVAKTIIPTVAPEAGIAGPLPDLDPTEEGFECQVNPQSHVLEDLTVDIAQGRALRLQRGQPSVLLVERNTSVAQLPGQLAFFQQAIVEPATLFQGQIHQTPLTGCGIETVQEGLTHSGIIAQRPSPYIPTTNAWSFTVQPW